MRESVEEQRESPNCYGLIAQKLNIPATAVVYYPCSGPDDFPRKGFPHNRFIFADQYQANMEALAIQGEEAHTVDVRTFMPTPDGVDVLIIQNPQLNALTFVDKVKPGGIIIANNWHSSANQVRRQEDMELVAVVLNPRNQPVWDDKDVNDCFEQVITDDDLRKMGKLDAYRKLVDKYAPTDNEKSVIERYRTLYDASYEAAIGDHIVMDGNEPMGYRSLPSLPTKKGFGLDDIAIFRKRDESPEVKKAKKEAKIKALTDSIPEIIEPWLAESLAKVLAINIAVQDRAALYQLLLDTDLTPLQFVLIEHIAKYFRMRTETRRRFLEIAQSDRWQFRMGLEDQYGIQGDPEFAAELPAEVLNSMDFFTAHLPAEDIYPTPDPDK